VWVGHDISRAKFPRGICIGRQTRRFLDSWLEPLKKLHPAVTCHVNKLPLSRRRDQLITRSNGAWLARSAGPDTYMDRSGRQLT
jgi:hypothetical protein